jgi:site-specific recombinase XerD
MVKKASNPAKTETASYQVVSLTDALPRPKADEVRVATSELPQLCNEYLLDCEYRQHKPHTIKNNRCFLQKFIDFLNTKGAESCGRHEIRLFLHELQQPPPESPRKPLRPVSARGYHRCLATFFKWLVSEEILPSSPMLKVPPPPRRGVELKQPLSQEAVAKLLRAAKTSFSPRRDEAILLMLLDTGLRAAELCSLRMNDVDLENRAAKVMGKGNKIRVCYWGVGTAKALARYLRGQKRDPHDPLFKSERGQTAGQALTTSGLYQIIAELGKAVGIKCGCHDWRRLFAVSMLRNGSNLVAVSRMMGHESLEVTRVYLNLAESDLEAQHRAFSPVDRLKVK